jgi:hypothetical protein
MMVNVDNYFQNKIDLMMIIIIIIIIIIHGDYSFKIDGYIILIFFENF